MLTCPLLVPPRSNLSNLSLPCTLPCSLNKYHYSGILCCVIGIGLVGYASTMAGETTPWSVLRWMLSSQALKRLCSVGMGSPPPQGHLC